LKIFKPHWELGKIGEIEKQDLAVLIRSLIPHGCGMEAYTDVFTASSEKDCWNLLEDIYNLE
jgi:hypothetical protein